MNKSYKKGFIFAELVAVSVTIITVLLVIYIQFVSVNDSYKRSFTYNNVDKLYLVDEFRSYINTETTYLNSVYNLVDTNKYVDITSCGDVIENVYCRNLVSSIDAKKIVITHINTKEFYEFVKDNEDFSSKFKEYLKTTSNKEESGYKIIIEFNDSEIATLKLNVDIHFSDGQVVYYNPILDEKCNDGDANCMKWYAFLDNSTHYIRLILDHNLIPRIPFEKEVGPLKTFASVELNNITSSWKVKPRNITLDEVVALTKSTFDLSNITLENINLPLFYFDQNASTYHYLFDNLYESVNYGGLISDDNLYNAYNETANEGNIYGYWVDGSDIEGREISVDRSGALFIIQNSDENVGVRPVIEVDKNKIKE